MLTFAFMHASSLPCLHTFWHAIPTSFYIFNVFYFLVVYRSEVKHRYRSGGGVKHVQMCRMYGSGGGVRDVHMCRMYGSGGGVRHVHMCRVYGSGGSMV